MPRVRRPIGRRTRRARPRVARRRQAAGATSRSGVEKLIGAVTSIPAVRKFLSTVGDDGPSWLLSALKYAKIAFTAIGYLGILREDDPSRGLQVGDADFKEIGGLYCVDIGTEDILADTSLVGPFMAAQEKEWKLAGCGWIAYDRAKVKSIDLMLRPTAQMSKRGGTVTLCAHEIDGFEAMSDGYWVKGDNVQGTRTHINRARVDTFAALASLGTAVTSDLDRPIRMRVGIKAGWHRIGINGAYLAEAHYHENLDDLNITQFGAGLDEARYGGRPILRVYIGFEDTNTANSTGSSLEMPENAGFELEVRANVTLAAPTGMPEFVKTASEEEVMEIASVNVVRRKPITIIEGGNMVMTKNNRFRRATPEQQASIERTKAKIRAFRVAQREDAMEL